jgi:riboflavin-specific deaminase-like protein
MQRIYPLPSHDLDVEAVYRGCTLPPPPADRPYVLLNFVQTIDGQTTLGERGAAGLGSAVDLRLMKRLRTLADALMHGATTVRRDNFPPVVPPDLEGERTARGLPPQPFGVVVSASGDLAPDNRYFSRPGTVILTTDPQVERLSALFGARAHVVGCGAPDVDVRRGLRALRERFGVQVLLCEGGSRLAYSLVADGLLDEIFLTIAPKLGSDRDALRLLEGPAFPPDALPRAELVHVLLEGSELFLRYRLPPS